MRKPQTLDGRIAQAKEQMRDHLWHHFAHLQNVGEKTITKMLDDGLIEKGPPCYYRLLERPTPPLSDFGDLWIE